MWVVWVARRVVTPSLRKGTLEDVADGIFHNGLNKIDPLLSFFILMFKLSLIWPVGAASRWSLWPLDASPSLSEHFLAF